MKRTTMLAMAFVVMLVSLGGCFWWGPGGHGGRGGHDGRGGHERGGDSRGGGHDRGGEHEGRR